MYTTIAAGDGVVHPTQPLLKKSVQIAAGVWAWRIGAQASYSTPVVDTEIAGLDTRISVLETLGIGTGTKIKPYTNGSSINNAVTAGISDNPTPVVGDMFTASKLNAQGQPERMQLWIYMGAGISARWESLSDTYIPENADTRATLEEINDSILGLQSTIDAQVEQNVEIDYATGPAPEEEIIPAVVAARDTTGLNTKSVVRISYDDSFADYMLDGQGQWYRRKIVYFTTAGEKPPLWPHPSAPIQRWIKENVEYTCELRDGGNISVDAFDVVNGKAHWRLSQQDDYLWHPIVMHLAEQWSTWRYAKYSGVVGGYFTLVSDNPSQSELTSPPLNNAIYVESNN